MANNCRFGIAAPQSIIERLLDSNLMKIVGDGVHNGILFTNDDSTYNKYISNALIDVSKNQPEENIIISYTDESTLYEVVSYAELINGTISNLDSDTGEALFENFRENNSKIL